MKNLIALFTLLVLCSALSADELVMKDGKKIEFKSLSDEGDHYDVTTPQGTKITVMKEDVEKLVPIVKMSTALTGAAFTFDKKRKLDTVDLLTKIDLKRDSVSGWRFTGGALIGTGTQDDSAPRAKIQIPITPPEEYDLTITAERKGGSDDIGFGLVGGGVQFAYVFDASQIWSGIYDVGGQGADTNGTGVQGKFFEQGKLRTIVFMVRKEALIVRADGKDHLVWKADWSKISLRPAHAVPSKNVFFVYCFKSTYSITKAVMTTPKN